MARLILRGGRPLFGQVAASGSKNSAEAILCAAALADEECVIEGVPLEASVLAIIMLLRGLGALVYWDAGGRVHVNGSSINSYRAPLYWAKKERGSFYAAGLLLAKLGKVRTPMPGGCNIGARPVDFHLDGFRKLGARVVVENKMVLAEARKLTGARIYVGRSSVGATINLMLAASMAEGQTVLENAAKEPEIVDTATFMNKMGACIEGAGTNVIRITGVPRLKGTYHQVIPDRIEAGTFLTVAAIAGGDVLVTNTKAAHLAQPVEKLREAGFQLEIDSDSIRIKGERRPLPCMICTARYPGFATDLQSPFTSLMALADGRSVIRETIFPDRWMWIDELRRMGAEVELIEDTAVIKGVPKLHGAEVTATDLRAGAALVAAALGAKGETIINNAEVLNRGYEGLTSKLAALGAGIVRYEVDEPLADEMKWELEKVVSPDMEINMGMDMGLTAGVNMGANVDGMVSEEPGAADAAADPEG
ncbi:MAG TPA: UDP-N-acetylglucosamine 1-carboxyvinyltransferase [Firmicutes bacterium]|nr:UDP-N-acetylglucosamine 1-carboxyvinyltransferase [Bacillota bacterium]